MTTRTLLLALACATAVNPATHGADSQRTDTVNIRLTIDGKQMTAAMIDSATARDFLTLLPMTLTLEDYAATALQAFNASVDEHARAGCMHAD